MLLRIIASIILLFSVLTLPWWCSAILAIGLIVYYSYYIEAVAIFLLSDLLYGAPEARFFNITLVSFIVSIAFVIILELLKNKLRILRHN